MKLFADTYAEPVDTRTQIDRMPGTIDAPCICHPDRQQCQFPWCPFPTTTKEAACES